MITDGVDYAKGETPMTDYQFKTLMASISETNRLKDMMAKITDIFSTSKDLNEARDRFTRVAEIGNSSGDEAMRERCEELEKENALLRGEQAQQTENMMTDNQFRILMQTIYVLVKSNVEAGKTPEEILETLSNLNIMH